MKKQFILLVAIFTFALSSAQIFTAAQSPWDARGMTQKEYQGALSRAFEQELGFTIEQDSEEEYRKVLQGIFENWLTQLHQTQSLRAAKDSFLNNLQDQLNKARAVYPIHQRAFEHIEKDIQRSAESELRAHIEKLREAAVLSVQGSREGEIQVQVLTPEKKFNLVTDSNIDEKKRGETHVSLFSFGIQNPQMRETMEDADAFKLNIPGFPQWSYFGVFDGHGGRNVADIAANSYEGLSTLDQLIFKELRKGVSVPVAAAAATIAFDSQLSIQHIKGGATAIIFLLNTETSRGYLINLGDARGVVASGQPPQVVLATTDHKPAYEVVRIDIAGGSVSEGYDRIIFPDTGSLGVSRALGSLYGKPFVDKEKTRRRDMVGQRPDVYEFNILPQDKFIILACDGVWDVLENNQAVEIVAQALSLRPKDGAYAAMKLVEAAYKGFSSDNITAMVVPLNATGSPHEARKNIVHMGYDEPGIDTEIRVFRKLAAQYVKGQEESDSWETSSDVSDSSEEFPGIDLSSEDFGGEEVKIRQSRTYVPRTEYFSDLPKQLQYLVNRFIQKLLSPEILRGYVASRSQNKKYMNNFVVAFQGIEDEFSRRVLQASFFDQLLDSGAGAAIGDELRARMLDQAKNSADNEVEESLYKRNKSNYYLSGSNYFLGVGYDKSTDRKIWDSELFIGLGSDGSVLLKNELNNQSERGFELQGFPSSLFIRIQKEAREEQHLIGIPQMLFLASLAKNVALDPHYQVPVTDGFIEDYIGFSDSDKTFLGDPQTGVYRNALAPLQAKIKSAAESRE